jgi:thiamine pyrophosphokinase
LATTVVFSGGPAQGPEVDSMIRDLIGLPSAVPEVVVAADAGLEICLRAGLVPDVVVGDMDSVAASDLSRAEQAGARIERHPRDKDATDIELALEVALDLAGPDWSEPQSAEPQPTGPGSEGRRLLVFGSAVGRLDHLLASMLLLGSPRYQCFEVDALLGSQRIVPVHEARDLDAPVGTMVSLIALHGEGCRVTTRGLRWPLADHQLAPASSLGVSNEFVEPHVHIEVSGPPVTVILPGEPAGRIAEPARPVRRTGEDAPEVAPHD